MSIMRIIEEIVGLVFFLGMVILCPFEYSWIMMGFVAVVCYIHANGG